MQPFYAPMTLEQLVGSTSRMLGHHRLKARGQLIMKIGSLAPASLAPAPAPAPAPSSGAEVEAAEG